MSLWKQQHEYRKGDRVVIDRGGDKGSIPGRIRRKKGGPVGEREDRWIVDYDDGSGDGGYHSPHEIRYIQ